MRQNNDYSPSFAGVVAELLNGHPAMLVICDKHLRMNMEENRTVPLARNRCDRIELQRPWLRGKQLRELSLPAGYHIGCSKYLQGFHHP